MEFLKELFGEGALTFEQFSQAVADKGFKLADLSTGNYVGKHKHDDELSAKDTAIADLKQQIKQRDTDIQGLKTQLADAGNDATKLAEVTQQLEKLQGDDTTAKKDYEARLGKQSYEFAVAEYANNLKFTSEAAKREFKRAMVAENLKVKDETIIGADDFTNVYKEANADSFVTEPKEPETPPAGPQPPMFVQPTAPKTPGSENPFDMAFNFMGVRPHETK